MQIILIFVLFISTHSEDEAVDEDARGLTVNDAVYTRVVAVGAEAARMKWMMMPAAPNRGRCWR